MTGDPPATVTRRGTGSEMRSAVRRNAGCVLNTVLGTCGASFTQLQAVEAGRNLEGTSCGDATNLMRSRARSLDSTNVLAACGTCNGTDVELHMTSASGGASLRRPVISTFPCTAAANRKMGPESADAAFKMTGGIAKRGNTATNATPCPARTCRSFGFTNPAFRRSTGSAGCTPIHMGCINRAGIHGGAAGNSKGAEVK